MGQAVGTQGKGPGGYFKRGALIHYSRVRRGGVQTDFARIAAAAMGQGRRTFLEGVGGGVCMTECERSPDLYSAICADGGHGAAGARLDAHAY